MVYEWKIPIYKLPAQAAGEELERIASVHGELTAESVVEESRSETAVLHGCFEWNDQQAAEQYRILQAEKIIRTITVKIEKPDSSMPIKVRAFYPVDGAYEPIGRVVAAPDVYQRLLHTAMEELSAFRQKYQALTELREIFDKIDDLHASCVGAKQQDTNKNGPLNSQRDRKGN